MYGKPDRFFNWLAINMAYTVLARRYRSQGFDEVIGQEAIAQTLKNAIKAERVGHAYLFTGTRGVGKTTMARILAKALNCLESDGPTTKPCCKCESCIGVNAGDDIDVIEIDGASNTGVDNVRELRQNAIYRPARGRYKIYIIDEVHMLSTGAFNALLKILEEPPGHVKFIFATTEPNKVLATIQSRCQRFDFNNIEAGQIAGQLKKVLKAEKIKYEDDLITGLARLANGSMRDGLSLLDQLISSGAECLTAGLLEEFLGQPNRQKVCQLVEKIGDSDAKGTLVAINELLVSGQSPVGILGSVSECMRDLMVVKSAKDEAGQILVVTSQQRARLAELAEKFDIAGLVYNITTLERLRWMVKNSENARPLLEASILRIALSEHFLNVDSLLSGPGGGGIKKKKVISDPPRAGENKNTTEVGQASQVSSIDFGGEVNIESIRNNWQAILNVVDAQAGSGISSKLAAGEPVGFENNVLKISFPVTAAIAKSLCEAGTGVDKIQSVLSGCFGRTVRVNLLLDENAKGETKRPPGAKTSKKQLDSIVNDPAVQKVLMGLTAKVLRVDEV